MVAERGVSVDHSSINRWAIRFLPLLEKIFRKYKRPVGGSWPLTLHQRFALFAHPLTAHMALDCEHAGW